VAQVPEPAGPGAALREGIYAARFILVAAIAALAAASILWDVPFAFSLAAGALLVAIATLAPRRRGILGRAGEATEQEPASRDAAVEAAVEAMPQAGLLLDQAGIVRYANARARERFPATRPGDLFTLTFRAPEIGEALEEALSGAPRSIEHREPGATTSAYAVSFNPIARPGGVLLVTFDDVSDRLAIARMRADFVANASHELRTPLASLTGFVETLLGPARNDPQATEKFLRIMLDQAQRMRRLIDDLLSLSRVEMRVHQRPTENVELISVLRSVIDALAPVARAQSVAVALEEPPNPIEVFGDRDELVQVFQNLVENAVRYGASGGRVDVTFETRPAARPSVLVHVQDHGPGIAPEHLPRLTERFYRVDVGASREMKGTGLGLAIVKHILLRHQGRLEVWSEPGRGARFTVELPARLPNEQRQDKS
jgi:two-component system phosphate regulon sensor histidine kinase PhoR